MARQKQAASPGAVEPPPGRYAKMLKWVAGISALLSLAFAIHQLVQLVSDVRERERSTIEFYKTGKQQQDGSDFAGAWASFEQGLRAAESGNRLARLTGQLGKERRQLRQAQEDLAMQWLEGNAASASSAETQAQVLEKLVVVLNRGIVEGVGPRKADMLAHLGWADFLRWRLGRRELNPGLHYQQAIALDPGNPYAHAYTAHWELWTRRKAVLKEADAHFAAAVASPRARSLVRALQLSAMRNLGEEGDAEFVRVVNDMRKNSETIDARTRGELYGFFNFALSESERLERLLAVVPATEQIDTLRALFYGTELDPGKMIVRQAYLATLQEAAGLSGEALQTWQALRADMSAEAHGTMAARADVAIKRLSSLANH